MSSTQSDRMSITLSNKQNRALYPQHAGQGAGESSAG